MQRLLTLSALLALLFSPAATAQEASLGERIDEILSAFDSSQKPGAAVAYVEDGEVVFARAYGLANLEHRIGWTTDTVSDLGSVSKQFIGFAVAMLAEQGRLGLDDDIRLYLNDIPDFGETITIRHLFNHTSGLREIYNTLYLVNRKPGDIIFQEDARTLVQYQEKLQFSPGSQYLYNNTEYMLLADIVEEVTGQEFHRWMDANIFTPLGMNDTHVMHEQGQVIPRVASSYVRRNGGAFTQQYDNSTIQGAGGIYSTVEDMTKWIANFSRLEVGSPGVLAMVTESGELNNGESLDYGLGMGVDTSGDVLQWSHGGSSAGYRSMLMYLPEHKRGYIFQTNTPSLGMPVRELTEAFLGDVLTLPEPPATPTMPAETTAVELEDPSVYTGRYFSDELEAFYSVLEDEDRLKLSHRWLGTFEMRYRGDDEFGFVDRGGSVAFQRNGDDDIAGFTVETGRTVGVEFRRLD